MAYFVEGQIQLRVTEQPSTRSNKVSSKDEVDKTTLLPVQNKINRFIYRPKRAVK